MKADRYVGVLLEYASAHNPEPGVSRAPTDDEQVRALERLASRLGGRLTAIVSAQQGRGLDPGAIDVVTAVQPAGVLVLTVDAFRRDRYIDVELLQKIWETAGEIGFLIEGEHLADDPSFEYYMTMVMAINHVRSRDASADWDAFVGRPSRS
ncbi:MAG: hypothetical protein GWP47_11810 [Actinobacteria bacterium]|jgi:hypothetical protein|nr:hypothetical protein [Actinomycetota bacterium]NCG38286.1 hypothetical protein [Actinomycetota bacterium]